jgi:hypothetical protein
MLDPHPAMPLMKLLEQVRVYLEQIQRSRVRQRRGFHEAEEQEEIVQLGRLLTQILFIAAKCRAVHELAKAASKDGQLFGPTHAPIITRCEYIWTGRTNGVRVFGGDVTRQTDRGLTVSIFGVVYPDINLGVDPRLV